MAKRVALWMSTTALALLLAGCGADSSTTACPSQPLVNNTSSGSNFNITPVDPMLVVYPGETTTIAVNVNSVNGSTGSVTLGSSKPLQGVTITGGTATIGSTANVTLTTSNDVVNTCFTGELGVYTADRALTISASNASGTSSAQWNMEVQLENKTFKPATTYLPIMNITTSNGVAITSEDDYVNASMTITDSTTKANNYSGNLEIKGHGNTTWVMPKKPYRLKLDSKAALLGMTSDANWILLANYDDKTLLRNDVSLKMSSLFGMAWTPNTVFVEMYLNGEYEGVYELAEKVEVSKARLNIGSMDDTDTSGTNLTGGYLAEIDIRNDETFTLLSQVNLPIGLDDPDPPVAEQQAYFTSAFRTAEASMYDQLNWTDPSTGWQAYWDSTSLVNYFLVEELANNVDAGDVSSDYFYKPRSDPKFYRGPVWDMDITFGNVNYSPTVNPYSNFIIGHSKWYGRLFDDPAFVALVKARWAVVRPQAVALESYLDTRQAALETVQSNNFARWPNLGEKVWPNPTSRGTYDAEIAAMKAYLVARIAYMDQRYGQ